jgi:hypothetical protein
MRSQPAQSRYVSRSAGLVVVRQGKPAGQVGGAAQALSSFDDELWKRIMSARLP